jgi:hypothetical protein
MPLSTLTLLRIPINRSEDMSNGFIVLVEAPIGVVLGATLTWLLRRRDHQESSNLFNRLANDVSRDRR